METGYNHLYLNDVVRNSAARNTAIDSRVMRDGSISCAAEYQLLRDKFALWSSVAVLANFSIIIVVDMTL
jgi:hypothetical protein